MTFPAIPRSAVRRFGTMTSHFSLRMSYVIVASKLAIDEKTCVCVCVVSVLRLLLFSPFLSHSPFGFRNDGFIRLPHLDHNKVVAFLESLVHRSEHRALFTTRPRRTASCRSHRGSTYNYIRSRRSKAIQAKNEAKMITWRV